MAARLVLLLLAALVALPAAQSQADLVDCSSVTKECFVEPCQVPQCKEGEKCLACGCDAVCVPAGTAADLQWPLHKCGSSSLATTCAVLSSIPPGSKCETVKCKPEHTCKEYLCDGQCEARCVIDPASGGGSDGGGSSPDPPEYTYTACGSVAGNKCTADPSCAAMLCEADSVCTELDCGDGQGCKARCTKVEQKPDPSIPIFNYYCAKDDSIATKCDPLPGQAVACNPECTGKTFCAPMMCGESKECLPVCVKDPVYDPPPPPDPSPSGYTCLDGSPAFYCYTEGGFDNRVCGTCGDGQVCSQFQCGSSSSECKTVCLTDPNYRPYMCEGGTEVAKKCEPPADKTTCSPKCSEAGTFCASGLECQGECKARCTKDPWWEATEPVQSDYMLDGTPAYFCNTAGDYDDAVCSACKEGNVCAQFQRGKTGQCATMCLADPFYKPYMCEDKTTVAHFCELTPTDDLKSNYCDGTCTEPGMFCSAMDCGGECKWRCIRDPYYVPPPLTCLNGGFVAEPCVAEGSNKQDCSALQCLSDGSDGSGMPQVCGDYTCDNVCATQCVRQGWYYPFLPFWQGYSCPDNSGSIAKACTFAPSGDEETCETKKCEDGTFCQTLDCGAGCAPMCVPPPPPILPIWRDPATCPDGVETVECSEDLCVGQTCPGSSSCAISKCGTCQPFCQPTWKGGGPYPDPPVEDGIAGGGAKDKAQRCAIGKAVNPKKCTKNMCANKCKGKKQRCVVDYCGGCHTSCVSKTPCPNSNTRRGCKRAALNFCSRAKCGNGAKCVPDQCNGCSARCVGPCPAGQFVNADTARCELCPKGMACPAAAKGRPTPDPVPCNGGRYADKQGLKACLKCKAGTTTPKPKKGSKAGYAKCTRV